MEDNLLEAILGGYKAVFTESMNAWAYNTPPTSNGVNMPMGSYQNIMKQLPSSTGAVGTAGDNTRADNKNYQYNQSLPDSNRDIGEETKKDWKSAPSFKKFQPNTPTVSKRLIERARKDHLPAEGDNMYTPMNYYNNFPMGNSMARFDVNSSKMPPF